MFVYVKNAKLRASELFKTPQRRLVDFTKSTRISPHGNRHHATLPSAWIVEDLHQFQHPPTFQVVWVMASTMFQHVFFSGDHIWSTPGHGARSSSYPGLASGCPARFPMPWLVVKNDNDLTLANGSFEAGGSTWNSSCLIMFQPIPQISTVSNSIQQSICKMSPWGWSSHI